VARKKDPYTQMASGFAEVAPCVGCGYCCSKVLCMLAYQKHFSEGVTSPPCPELRHHDGRYWCGIIEDAPEGQKIQYMEALGIGAGCSSSMFNTVRDSQIAKMGEKNAKTQETPDSKGMEKGDKREDSKR